MFRLHVLGQVQFGVVAFAAEFADVNLRVLGLAMSRDVRQQVLLLLEREVTRIAFERTTTLVRSHVRS